MARCSMGLDDYQSLLRSDIETDTHCVAAAAVHGYNLCVIPLVLGEENLVHESDSAWADTASSRGFVAHEAVSADMNSDH